MNTIKRLLKNIILPLVIVFHWDVVTNSDPNVVVQGIRVKGAPVTGGPYTIVYAQTTDPNGTTTTDGSLTSGETRCYVSVSYGTIGGSPAESVISSEVCKTNTEDAPLVGPVPGGGGNLPATR